MHSLPILLHSMISSQPATSCACRVVVFRIPGSCSPAGIVPPTLYHGARVSDPSWHIWDQDWRDNDSIRFFAWQCCEGKCAVGGFSYLWSAEPKGARLEGGEQEGFANFRWFWGLETVSLGDGARGRVLSSDDIRCFHTCRGKGGHWSLRPLASWEHYIPASLTPVGGPDRHWAIHKHTWVSEGMEGVHVKTRDPSHVASKEIPRKGNCFRKYGHQIGDWSFCSWNMGEMCIPRQLASKFS